jgi:hypothetical protein
MFYIFGFLLRLLGVGDVSGREELGLDLSWGIHNWFCLIFMALGGLLDCPCLTLQLRRWAVKQATPFLEFLPRPHGGSPQMLLERSSASDS